MPLTHHRSSSGWSCNPQARRTSRTKIPRQRQVDTPAADQLNADDFLTMFTSLRRSEGLHGYRNLCRNRRKTLTSIASKCDRYLYNFEVAGRELVHEPFLWLREQFGRFRENRELMRLP